MYSILLVDDEESVRSSIRNLTPWEKHGFEIMGEASNGIEALDIISEKMPDVIITDIKMPYINGIEFIEKIRKDFSSTVEIIILSGYDEFTFAQEAVRLKVAEYALKPVSIKMIEELLDRTKDRIEKDKLRFLEAEKIEPVYKEAFSLYKERYLASLIAPSRLSDNDKESNSFGINLTNKMIAVGVMDAADSLFMLQKLAEEAIEREAERPIIFPHENQIVFIFNTSMIEEYAPLFKKQIYRVLNLIQESSSHYFAHHVNIGISNIVTNIDDIPLAYKDAVRALNYTHSFPEQHIITLSDIENVENEKVERDLGELKTELIFAIKLGSSHDTEVAISNFFSTLTETSDIQAAVLYIISTISEICTSYSKPITSLLKEDLFSTLAHMTTLTSAKKICLSIALAANDMANGERESSRIKFVETAKKVIKKRYSDPLFGLDQLCEEISVSPAYFSTTFKKETGISFVQFLTNTRLEKAKEMLKNSELKTYEIAERTGFSEPNYFSFAFKKNTGVSPSQYRSQSKQQ